MSVHEPESREMGIPNSFGNEVMWIWDIFDKECTITVNNKVTYAILTVNVVVAINP